MDLYMSLTLYSLYQNNSNYFGYALNIDAPTGSLLDNYVVIENGNTGYGCVLADLSCISYKYNIAPIYETGDATLSSYS